MITGWGDNSTTNSPINTNGSWTASHLYNASAVGIRHLTANLTSAGGQIKASTSTTTDIVVRKHTTSLSIRAPKNIVSKLTFTVAGDVFDTSYGTANPVPISGAQISFNGTGATTSLLSVKTQGVTFFVPGTNWCNENFKLYKLSI